jgi:hypothetical protein
MKATDMTFNRNFALAALAIATLGGCSTTTGSINGRGRAAATGGFCRDALNPNCREGRNSERALRARL